MKRVSCILLWVLLMGPFAYTQEAAWPTGRIDLLGPWGGLEQEALFKILEPFQAATGIRIDYTGTRDWALVSARVRGGNPPDLFISPVPAVVWEFAREGYLVPLDSFMNMDQLEESFAPTWLELGSVDDHLYGLMGPVTIKSLVWYNPAQFSANGYQVPKTWDELVALTEQIAADEKTPWSIAMECGDATGWPGTDWIEDIMLRTVGPEVYDQWVNHEISWTDPRVKRAWELFGQIALNEKYVFGGIDGELSTFFGDGADPLFTDPPRAYMHRMALFIYDFIRNHFPDVVPGKDVDFFVFPPIDPQYDNPLLVAGEMVVMFRDTPENRALMRYWASVGTHELIVAHFGRLSPNKKGSPYVYGDPILRKAAQVLTEASAVRFDGSDLMPSEIGTGAFWQGVINYLTGEDLDAILEEIEAIAEGVY